MDFGVFHEIVVSKPWHDRREHEHVIPKFREPAVSASAR